MKPRILFVDDEPAVLNGIRRILRQMRDAWEVDYCTSGKDALAIVDGSMIDVMVTDMRMPGMDGAQLCHEVSVRSPQTIRTILTGQSSADQIMRAFGMAHRCLSKPCPPDFLIYTLSQTLSLQKLINAPPLMSFMARINALPTMPGVFAELMNELLSAEADMSRIADLVSSDMAVSCRVLQLVNSAYFGLKCRVDSAAHAAKLLGLERLKGLVLTAGLFAQFDSDLPSGICLDALQQVSLTTSLLAGEIMRAEIPQSLSLSNKAVVAGAVHDIGQLVLLQNRAEQYCQILAATRQCHEQLCAEELKVFGVTHAEVGAYLLNLWGLDADIVDAVAHHHDPCATESKGFTVLTALHVSEALIHELNPKNQWPFGATLNHEYIDDFIGDDQLQRWRLLTKHCLGEQKS